MKGLGCLRGLGVQGLGCARVIMVYKGQGVQSKEARTHRNKDTPATKLFFYDNPLH